MSGLQKTQGLHFHFLRVNITHDLICHSYHVYVQSFENERLRHIGGIPYDAPLLIGRRKLGMGQANVR